MNFLVLELNLYGPKISAMGFFNVGYSLIPTVSSLLADCDLKMIQK